MRESRDVTPYVTLSLNYHVISIYEWGMEIVCYGIDYYLDGPACQIKCVLRRILNALIWIITLIANFVTRSNCLTENADGSVRTRKKISSNYLNVQWDMNASHRNLVETKRISFKPLGFLIKPAIRNLVDVNTHTFKQVSAIRSYFTRHSVNPNKLFSHARFALSNQCFTRSTRLRCKRDHVTYQCQCDSAEKYKRKVSFQTFLLSRWFCINVSETRLQSSFRARLNAIWNDKSLRSISTIGKRDSPFPDGKYMPQKNKVISSITHRNKRGTNKGSDRRTRRSPLFARVTVGVAITSVITRARELNVRECHLAAR